MPLRIRTDVAFAFPVPARNLTVILRLSPRSHEGQHVTGARIDADIDCSLKAGEDAFGNITHSFSAAGPLSAVTVSAVCRVETYDAAGIVRGTAERLPTDIFLRETGLTATDADLRHFAERATAAETEPLGKLHALMEAAHREIDWDETPLPPGPPPPPRPAAEVFAAKSADAAGHAHVFAAAARHLGLPCRHVTGYLLRDGAGASAIHAWCEAHVPNLGWIGFDSAEKICPNGRHVRVVAGLDALGAALFRGSPAEGFAAAASVTAS